MSIRLKAIDQQVIVITGASSGIGLATAWMAAQRGAKVVLAARSGPALHKIEQQMRSKGFDATAVEADVSRREDLERVRDVALDRYGRIDTWVNNAGLSIYGRLGEVSPEDHRKLFDINFWGLVDGSLIAADYLRDHGGAIINLGSIVSDMAIPLQGMYVASKHAVKGFTDALRIELKEEQAPVSVTLIKPAAINTPYPEHAENYLGRELKLPDPLYRPEEVARAILHAAEHPIRDLNVGGAGVVMTTMANWVPRLMDWVSAKMMSDQQVVDRPPQGRHSTLRSAGNDSRISGEHPFYVRKTSSYTRAAMHPVAAGAIVATLGIATAALLRPTK